MSHRTAVSHRERIEIGIARGLDWDRIADQLNVSLDAIAAVWAQMEDAVNEDVQPDGRTNHGTHSGYVTHRNHNEQPCPDCITGEYAYQADRRKARKKAA